MPVCRANKDVEFLKRVDAAYRSGTVLRDIADKEKTSAGGLANKVNRLGFKFTRDGGLRLIDLFDGRDLSDWLRSGDIVVTPDEGLVAA